MKDFFSTFIICLLLLTFGTFLFAGFLFNNIWALVIIVALFMSTLITIFMNQDSRIEELEKKLNQLQNDKEKFNQE